MYLDLGLEYRKCSNGGHNSTYSTAQINSVLKKSLQPSFLSISITHSQYSSLAGPCLMVSLL